MTPRERELYDRAVELGLAKWRPGMGWELYGRLLLLDHGRIVDEEDLKVNPPDGSLPSTSDSSTLGALLGYARQTLDEPALHLRPRWYEDGSVRWQPWARTWIEGKDMKAIEEDTEFATLLATLVEGGGE